MNRNSTRHHIFDFSDGTVVTESRKNAWGGWVNMMRRVAEAHNDGHDFHPADSEGAVWVCADGRTVTVTEWQKV